MAVATDEKARVLQFLDASLGERFPETVGIRLWDGQVWPDRGPHRVELVLNHPGALRQMLLSGTETGLAEAYLRDDFDVAGDMESVFALAETLNSLLADKAGWLELAGRLRRLPATPRAQRADLRPAKLRGRLHSAGRDAEAVRYHYDVSGDFYRLWLDSRMVYSCAYFRSPSDSLDTAQERKLEYICHKLQLRPGQRLLDIGCGWGGLVIHAAASHGADATGITLSRPQADLANERIRAAGLSGRARVLVQDYREADDREGYDAIVSVGMFEHVGVAKLPEYFGRAYRLLKPTGAFLNHGIAKGYRRIPRFARGPSFSQRYVFPDGELVPIAETLAAAEGTGFEVRDVECLREHYQMTLRHWVSRLEQRHDAALELVDERTYRVWRLFMSGSAYGFGAGLLSVYQALLAKPDATGRAGMPLTREGWYEGQAGQR